jgi:membrane protein involved in colicin uptake
MNKGTRHEARGTRLEVRSAKNLAVAVIVTLCAATAWAKIPPPPPPDEKQLAAAADKKEKDAAAAKKATEDLDTATDKAVKNFQSNMKKQGKPIPKPTPIVAAAAAQPMPPSAGGKSTPTPGGNPASGGAASAKGHEQGAMTPAGNTPAKGTDTPKDAQKNPKK